MSFWETPRTWVELSGHSTHYLPSYLLVSPDNRFPDEYKDHVTLIAASMEPSSRPGPSRLLWSSGPNLWPLVWAFLSLDITGSQRPGAQGQALTLSEAWLLRALPVIPATAASSAVLKAVRALQAWEKSKNKKNLIPSKVWDANDYSYS